MRRAFDLYGKHPSLLCFIIAGTLLFCGIVNLQSSLLSRDFEETTGEIYDVEVRKVLHHGTYVTRYDYVLTWYVDGQQYTRYLTGQVDAPKEGKVSVWASHDNREYRLDPSEEIAKEAYIAILIGLLVGGLGIFLSVLRRKNRKESKAERLERLEDTKIASIIAFVLSLFGAGIVVIAFNYSDYHGDGYMGIEEIGDIDLLVVCGLIAVVSLITFLIAKHAGKR